MFPAYDIAYEMDFDGEVTGDVLAVHLYGHGHSLDVVELVLHNMSYEWGEEYLSEGGWNVTEAWVRKVPLVSGGSRFVYSASSGRGAREVTVVEKCSFWGYWCHNHPYEPASTGHPASNIINGESLVAQRMEALAEEEDPRKDVEDRGMGGYVYMCRECSTKFSDRIEEARKATMKQLEKAAS